LSGDDLYLARNGSPDQADSEGTHRCTKPVPRRVRGAPVGSTCSLVPPTGTASPSGLSSRIEQEYTVTTGRSTSANCGSRRASSIEGPGPSPQVGPRLSRRIHDLNRLGHGDVPQSPALPTQLVKVRGEGLVKGNRDRRPEVTDGNGAHGQDGRIRPHHDERGVIDRVGPDEIPSGWMDGKFSREIRDRHYRSRREEDLGLTWPSGPGGRKGG
jgi:hypothetical protein